MVRWLKLALVYYIQKNHTNIYWIIQKKIYIYLIHLTLQDLWPRILPNFFGILMASKTGTGYWEG